MRDQIGIFESKVVLQPKIYQSLKKYLEFGSNPTWRNWSRILIEANDDERDYPKNNISLLEFDKEAFITTGDGKHKQATRLARAIRQILLAVQPDLDLDGPGLAREFGDFTQYLQGVLSSLENLQLVSGPEIAKYYKIENITQSPGSEISKSCMVGKPNNTFDIYTQNPDTVSLLIRKEGDKISARALVWKLSEPSDCIYLDRIYSVGSRSKELGVFLIFLENKFIGKKIFFHEQPNQNHGNFRVELKKCLFEKYPYLDSFKYLYLEYMQIDYNRGIIKRLKDFFKKKDTKTNKLWKIVKAINSGFLMISRNNQLEENHLLFTLRDHVLGSKSPENSVAIEPQNHIYEIEPSFQEVTKFLDSGEKLTSTELVDMCNIVLKSGKESDEKDKIFIKLLDRFIELGCYNEFNGFLREINNNENLLSIIKKYKKWIKFESYDYIYAKFKNSEFIKRFLDLFPEGFDKDLFFYLDFVCGFNFERIDKKHLKLDGGYKPYGVKRVWDCVDTDWIFKLGATRGDRVNFYIELFFNDFINLEYERLTRFYSDRNYDISKLEQILNKTEKKEKLNVFINIIMNSDNSKNIFRELYNSILEKVVKYSNEDGPDSIFELCSILKFDKILITKLFDDLYNMGLSREILNNFIISRGLPENSGIKLYPQGALPGNKILKFESFQKK
jgi:hypothetical protein